MLFFFAPNSLNQFQILMLTIFASGQAQASGSMAIVLRCGCEIAGIGNFCPHLRRAVVSLNGECISKKMLLRSRLSIIVFDSCWILCSIHHLARSRGLAMSELGDLSYPSNNRMENLVTSIRARRKRKSAVMASTTLLAYPIGRVATMAYLFDGMGKLFAMPCDQPYTGHSKPRFPAN